MKYLKNLNFFTESKKYIKMFEKVDEYKIYYIISTKDLRKSLTNIGISKKGINEIIKYSVNIIKNKYVYFGFDSNDMWNWMPLEDGYNYDIVDGEFSYVDDNYTFKGYDNLTDEEYEEVQEIKKNIEIKNSAKKYNL